MTVAERVGVQYATINLGVGEEFLFQVSYGLIVISSNSNGQTAVFLKSNASVQQLHVSSDSFGYSFEVSYVSNTTIKIKNVFTTARSIEVISLAPFGKPH